MNLPLRKEKSHEAHRKHLSSSRSEGDIPDNKTNAAMRNPTLAGQMRTVHAGRFRFQIRGGMQQNGELLSEPNGGPVGLQGFADVGVRIPIFNRNQGNIATARADVERAKHEVERVKLALRERAASVVQNYNFSQTAVDRYKGQMIPTARSAYEMYAKKYQEMAAAYPQVLIAQRTLMQLEFSYITALETFATSSISLQSYLLTDGLEAPSQPDGIDEPVREMNIPFQMGTSPQER